MSTTVAWLQNCERNHEDCKLRVDAVSGQMPTRLIDLTYVDQEIIRLRLGNEILRQSAYATLSHCWGDITPLMLTKRSMEAIVRGVSLSSLPRTFRDAVRIAVLLNIRYLWIDSLCIVQDDDADWLAEAPLMGETYENAVCNLAATIAKNPNGGLFTTRDQLNAYPECVVMPSWSKSTGSAYRVRPTDIWKQKVQSGPLMQRAWVLQETTLARRNLHFTQGEIMWECAKMRASEFYPDGIPTSYYVSLTNHKLMRNIQSLPPKYAHLKHGPFGRVTLWSLFVQDYTRRLLTFPEKDKLVAISGLARRLASTGEYKAGIWEDHSAHQLLWSIHDDGRHYDISYNSAPSWSWASINAPLDCHFAPPYDPHHPDEHVELTVRVLGIQVDLAGTDRFGSVRGGSLTLHGYLIPTSIQKLLYLNGKGDTEVLDIGLCAYIHLDEKPDLDYEQEEERNFNLMPVRTLRDDTGYIMIEGIVLSSTAPCQCEIAPLPQYYRKGFFSAYRSDNDEAFFNDMAKNFSLFDVDDVHVSISIESQSQHELDDSIAQTKRWSNIESRTLVII